MLTPPIEAHPNFKYGGTTGKLERAASPTDRSEFSRRDPMVYVHALLEQTQKAKAAMVSARIFDSANRARGSIDPAKIKWAGQVPIRWGAGFSPATLEAGFYRIDFFFNDQAVWRAFIQISD